MMCAQMLYAVVFTTQALAEPNGYVFGGLAQPSDPATPNYQDYLDASGPKLASSAALAGTGDDGSVTWSLHLEGPAARRAADVTIAYNSNDTGPSRIAPGWSVLAGMTVSRPSRAAAALAWSDRPNAMMVSGGGLAGVLEPQAGSPGEWNYYGRAPGVGKAWFSNNDWDGWWLVKSQGVSTYLRARASEGGGASRTWEEL
jgi:hypothetical protein